MPLLLQIVAHLTPTTVAEVVASMGPALVNDLVREMGPDYTGEARLATCTVAFAAEVRQLCVTWTWSCSMLPS